MDLFEKCFDFTKPNDYRNKGIYPYFHCLETRQDKEVVMEGHRKIMLGSNNYLELPEKLKSIADYTRKAYRENNISFYNGTTPIVPIYTKDAEYTLTLASNLFKAGIYVNPVLPPATPADECLLRTSLMATVTEDLVDEAAKIISEEINKMETNE